MVLTDTHTHLYSRQFDADRDAVMQRAREAGVGMMLLPNVDQESVEGMHALEDAYPDEVRSMMGLHPCSVGDDWLGVVEDLFSWLDRRKYVAIGEIGIDLYWRKDNLDQQREAFLWQVDQAKFRSLPVVIHSRESTRVILDALGSNTIVGVFHCFSGTQEEAQRIIDRGMHLGIGGVVTYKNADNLRAIVREVDRSRVLLETDSPYLSPYPYRGQRNESARIIEVARVVAECWSMPTEEVAKICSRNAKTLFS
ncbi:MAG: TatD family deoxyribonuclease [Sphingomonadales bacterium]|nr:TatD family deoxyribonuclease [Sphingomonadales bacterium]